MTPLLDSISDPSDIKNFTSDQLNVLAEDIRHKIIDVVSVNGGHLASNLGIVELTIALHRVFNSPNDKFIFDVSHQTYPHKLLTGRQEKFSKIRQHKGLCGFSHPKESEHDHFLAGHAGTALSLALGVAKARDLLKSDEFVIPILGDASLTCGLTLEALNNIPKDLKNFIVILNDNKMSISKNTGAISNILSRIVNSPTSNKIYDDLEQMLAKIPSLGTFLAKQGTKVKESIKNLISAAPFFEQFGLSYVGPFDGHNTEQLIETLSALKDHNKPIILHVLTTKGKGMQTAINDPTCYHGCKPFDKQTGKFLPAKSVNPTFPQIFGKTLLEMASNDPSVVAITPAMPSGSCLEELMDIYPERCIDVGIAEGHSVTYGAGIAYNRKLKVVCSVYSTFLQRAFDNLFHDVCLQEIPIVFAIDRAGISGPDGSTHHGIYDISFLNAMPNMVICQPRNGQVLVDLLKSAFSWQRPVAIRYPNLMTQEESQPYRQRELGVSEVLQEGSKVAIIALGHMCSTALEVAKRFTEQQITPTVIDPIFIKPIDADMLYKILSTHQYIVTIEEHALTVGLGSIVNNFIVRNGFNNVLVANFGIPEVFVDHGSNAELLKEHGLSADKILEKCVDIFNMQHKLENMDTYL